MPEHFHLLIGEPRKGTPSTVMQALKQGVARKISLQRKRNSGAQIGLWKEDETPETTCFWQPRFYDFNVWTAWKQREKLRYMHMNPVKRKLVSDPAQWKWSSYRWCTLRERGLVQVNVDEGFEVITPTS